MLTEEQRDKFWWLGDKLQDLKWAIEAEKRELEKMENLAKETLADFKKLYMELKEEEEVC